MSEQTSDDIDVRDLCKQATSADIDYWYESIGLDETNSIIRKVVLKTQGMRVG
jgi:hypothetical protein